MPIKLKSFALSDIGLVRDNNEDVIKEYPDLKLYVLADGMGGHSAGEIAAEESVNAVCKIISDLKLDKRDITDDELIKFMTQTMEEVNQHVFQQSRLSEDLYGMGTTLCCLLFHNEKALYGHIGDSRIYLFRHNQLSQLTKDHSLVAELVDLGELTEDQADSYMHKNIVTKAVGTDPYVTPSVEIEEVVNGDIFLLASDGLTDLVSNEEIEIIFSKALDLQRTSQLLIKAALMKGGTDNVSVVLIKANRSNS